MKCEQCREHLTEYLNQALDKKLEIEIRQHLAVCPECLKEYEFLKSYLQEVRLIPAVQAPHSLLSGVRQRLEKPSIRQRLLKPFPQAILKGMGALAVLWVVLYIINPVQPLKRLDITPDLAQSDMSRKVPPEADLNLKQSKLSAKPETASKKAGNNPVLQTAPSEVEQNREFAYTLILAAGETAVGTKPNLQDNYTGLRKAVAEPSQTSGISSEAKTKEKRLEEEYLTGMLPEKIAAIKKILFTLDGVILREEIAKTGDQAVLDFKISTQNLQVLKTGLGELGALEPVSSEAMINQESSIIKVSLTIKR